MADQDDQGQPRATSEDRLSSKASGQRSLEAAIQAQTRTLRRELRVMFSQIEALLWLRDLLRLEHPLRATRGWAASPDLLLELSQQIREQRPAAVVELGSGVSSVVIGASLRRWGPGRAVALEHDEAYAERTRADLERQGLSSIVSVVHAPLADVTADGQKWRWYDVPDDALPTQIDLLFVDAPPGSTGLLARYPALPMLWDRLPPSAVVILDDGARPDERETAARWLAEHPDLTAELLPLEKGAWLFRRG